MSEEDNLFESGSESEEEEEKEKVYDEETLKKMEEAKIKFAKIAKSKCSFLTEYF